MNLLDTNLRNAECSPALRARLGDRHYRRITALGNLDHVAREVVKAEDIVDYTQRENVGLRLAKQFGVSIGQGFYKAAAGAGVQLR